jgi:hypothetical protein
VRCININSTCAIFWNIYLKVSLCALCVNYYDWTHVASVARHKSVSIVCVDWDSSIKRNVLKWTSIITSSFSVDISEEICIATAKMGKHVIRYCFRCFIQWTLWFCITHQTRALILFSIRVGFKGMAILKSVIWTSL